MYRFPTPRDPRVGAWGAPNTPKSPPSEKKMCMRFRTPPRNIFENKKLVGNCVLRPQEDVFAEKKIQLLKTAEQADAYMHTTLISPLLIIWCSDQYTYMSCPLTIYNHRPSRTHAYIYAYTTLGYHHLFR